MNPLGLFGKRVTGLTGEDQRVFLSVFTDFSKAFEKVGERLRELDTEIADFHQEVEALRSELAAIKREPHKSFAQKLREKGKP